METRANYAIIGIFTMAVIVAGFGFVFWFSGADTGARRSPFRVEFEGSVAGLSKGAPVLFNGIRVGDVTEVYFEADKPRRAFARIEIQPETPVRQDTRANLDVALLSGAAVIALTGGSPDAPAIRPRPGDAIPTIEAERGGLGSIIETARGTAERANVLIENLNTIVSANKDSITRTVQNVETFSTTLSQNAPQIERALASIGQAAERIGPVAGKLETLTEETTALIRSVDRQRVARIVENVDGVLQTVGENRQRIGNIMSDAATLVRGLADAVPHLQQTVTDAGRVVAAIDPVKINGIVDGASRFATALGNSARDTENAIRNANSLTAKLDAAAGRIDGVLKAAENFLGSAAGQEGKSTFASIREAAEKFGAASDNLSRRATDIAQGVTRFTGSGSRQVEGVASDARRTLNTVGRAAQNLERNPQSVIFGGGRPSLPDYGGR
jgi:phospholipid/cholesterol/gamma-HCH transport system substrate-binding protein